MTTDIALLGVCDRYQHVDGGHPALAHTHVLGLRSTVVAPIFPLDLRGLCFVLGVRDLRGLGKVRFVARAPNGAEIFWVDAAFNAALVTDPNAEIESPPAPAQDQGSNDRSNARVQIVFPTTGVPCWIPLQIVPPANSIVRAPGEIRLFASIDGTDHELGTVIFAHGAVPVLTPDIETAARADPRANKLVVYELGCKLCSTTMRIYAGYDRNKKQEDAGAIWFAEAPAEFRCECAKTEPMDLEYVRAHLKATLLLQAGHDDLFTYHRLFELSALEQTRDKFWALLDAAKSEEEVQKFLRDNPVLLQFLSPERILLKPPVLAKFKADFAVVDHRQRLVLVEIEKADAPLLKQDGSKSAELEHAYGQVQDWLLAFDEHRSACLDSMGIGGVQVTQIVGLVVAGRDRTKNDQHLRKLKWHDGGRIQFMTYDDVGRSLELLCNQMRDL